MERELIKEFTFNKLLLMSNFGGGGKNSSFDADFRQYVNMHFNLESSMENIEEQMRKQYELIRHTTPKLFRDKDGKARVSGLHSHISRDKAPS